MKDICIFICSDKVQLPDKGIEFIDIVLDFSQILGVKLDHFYYDISDNENDEDTSYEGQFYIDELSRLIKRYYDKEIISLALWSEMAGNTSYDFRAELINSGQKDGYHYVIIQFSGHCWKKFSSLDLFSLVSKVLTSLNQIGQLDYALVTLMEPKLLETYFLGAFTEDLSDADALNLATWQSRLKERKMKLRGLYWGNLLGPGHLARLANRTAFMERLRALVGTQLVSMLDNETLFFMLPSHDINVNPIDASIINLLNDEDLLMQPDDKAREIISHVLSISKTRKH